MELRLTPAFGRHLLLTEGAAEVASDLAFPADRRAALYREKLFPAAELNAADIDILVRIEDLQRELLPVVTDVAREYWRARSARSARASASRTKHSSRMRT